MKCPNCGRVAAEGQKFCRVCGAKFESFHLICSDCGKPAVEGQKFCRVCGVNLESANQAALEKLKKNLEVSDRIEIEMMRKSLGMDEELFFDKIYDWAAEFNFLIDGEYIIVNKDSISDFLDMLNK